MNDIELEIATGTSRKTKVWKNKKMLWSQLVTRLGETFRTPETVSEYKAMSLSRQSEIKDVGGFVGGYCRNGSRSDVAVRSILCLDADYADRTIWDDWIRIYGNAAAVYTTHKHTPEKPRLRLVIPLEYPVSPDQYQAIGRRIASELGIDKFDDSTYQPQRMMYWPSTSQDGEFYCKSIDAEFLDPGTVLKTYRDWKDISSWPMSSRVTELANRTGARQQDPTGKGGIVGAFCRAYTITEAIDAFIPTYAACDEPNRYTYTEGSTAAGVVVYEDKWSYSHHGTDPASGQLCNAWDLVRLHRFGTLDAGCDPDAPASSRPSYKAMAGLASTDSRVSAQIVSDRMAEAEEAFSAPVEDTDWRGRLKTTEKGGIAQTIDNIVIILKHDPRLAGRLAYNEMEHAIVAMSSLPWRTIKEPSQWTDTDDAALRYYLEKVYGLTGKDRIFDAVNVAALEASYHPVRNYLESCAWDGKPRVESLLIDYLGAEDTAYTRAVTRKTLAAAVARIYKPGCKFDYMLTLRGKQGIGKSALVARLGGKWFSDSFVTLQGKEAYEQALGVWLMEVGELAGMRKAEAETIKQYISKQKDRFRPAYGRRTQEFPRQCIFIATTNEMQFLRDTTGNRRFWIVDTPNKATHDLWAELTAETVSRIWGEAVQIYNNGEELFLSKELEDVAREIQGAYEEENPIAGTVEAYLDRRLPENWENMDLYARREWLESDEPGTVTRETVCTHEIWAEALSMPLERLDRIGSLQICSCMSNLPEWTRQGNKKTRTLYGQQRYWRRKA